MEKAVVAAGGWLNAVNCGGESCRALGFYLFLGIASFL